ncbi:MAG TPA: cadherin-like domain-containing protein [Actinomycetota bacterium]
MRRATPRRRRTAIAAIAVAAAFLPVAPAHASHQDTILFTAMGDNTLAVDTVSTQAAVALEEGVPEVFHSNGSQGAEYPAGFNTVPGPFDQPGEPFDAILFAATAHQFAPQSADFTFQVKNGTTNEVITELTASEVSVDDIPLDDASESDPLSDHCPDGFDGGYSAVQFQITLAPPVNEVFVGPGDDLQLILTPTNLSSNKVELCVEDSFFYTGLALVIEPIPSAPVAADDSATTPKDTAVDIDVLANDSDADDDPLSVTNLTQPANGSTSLNGDGTVNYAPDPGFQGFDSFTYTANDGTDDSNTATVTVEVTNTPPDAVDDAASTFKNEAVTIDVLANDSDADGDPISVTGVGSPANGTATDNGDGTVTYEPDPGFSGFDSFTYTISDGTDSDTATVTVEVVNRPPDCSAATSSIDGLWPPNHRFVDGTVLGVTDPDGDAVTITIDSIFQDEPTGTNAPDGTGVGSPGFSVRAERLGSGDGRVYHVGFTADDGDGGTCSGTVLVGVAHDQGGGSTPVDGGPIHDSTV